MGSTQEVSLLEDMCDGSGFLVGSLRTTVLQEFASERLLGSGFPWVCILGKALRLCAPHPR